jgi:hypothetical protein
MPGVNERVNSVPNICGIELAFTGQLLPSTIDGYQVFTNSIPSDTDFEKYYASCASIKFDEESEESNAGISWKQKLVIKFPATDKQRAERLQLMPKVKYIKIKLDNKKSFVLGRNDYEQNVRPKFKAKVDEKLAQVEFSVQSITPVGYIPHMDAGGFPVLFPIDYIND